MVRVGILTLQHESNTFLAARTNLADFRLRRTGRDFREYCRGKHSASAAYFDELESAGIEAVPLLIAVASPAGPVTDEALDALWGMAESAIHEAGPLDGVLLGLHGAAVNESRPDMDGWILKQVRGQLGETKPLLTTLDPHANLSPAMIAAGDGLISYRENPHIDSYACGRELARLMIRILRGEVRPALAGAFPALAMNIERQFTGAEPLLSVKAKIDEIRRRPGVLSASVNFGFPYADVAEMGTSFMVITDNQPGLAQALADELAEWLVERRQWFRGELISPEAAIQKARILPAPVGLLDMGDNVGGGGCADSTVLARLCHEAENLRAFVWLLDPESAALARSARIGDRFPLRLGGKSAVSPAPPLECEVTLLSTHAGAFAETEVRHGGRAHFDMGPTAVVQTDGGLTVMLSSHRCEPYSLQQLLSCGINPGEFDVILIKGVHAPIAAYAPVCPSFIRVNTPGVTTAEMESLTYHSRRRPLFPFEEIPAVPFP